MEELLIIKLVFPMKRVNQCNQKLTPVLHPIPPSLLVKESIDENVSKNDFEKVFEPNAPFSDALKASISLESNKIRQIKSLMCLGK